MRPTPEHRTVPKSKQKGSHTADCSLLWPIRLPVPQEEARHWASTWSSLEAERSGVRRRQLVSLAAERQSAPGIDLLVDLVHQQETPFSEWIRVALQGALARSIAESAGRPEFGSASVRAMMARIDNLERKVQELADELKARPITGSATLLDLADDRLALSQPVQIVIEQYDGEATASWPEIEAFGSGSSASEAILALKRDIVALHLDLQSTTDEELGSLPLAWKMTLRRVVVSNETSKRQTA